MANAFQQYISQLKSDDWLTPAVERYFASLEEPESWKKTPDLHVSASSAGGTCARDIQLHMLGHRTGFNTRSRMRMDNGIGVHERVQGWLEKAGVLAESELYLTFFNDGHIHRGDFDSWDHRSALRDEHGFITWSGKIDLLVRQPGSQVLNVGEIKSAGEWKFKGLPDQQPDLKKMAYLMVRMEPEYTRQAIQYVVMLERAGYNVSPRCFLWFENTNNQQWRVIWFEPDDQLKVEAFKNLEDARFASQNGELIEPPFEKSSKQCRSCYREVVCNLLRDGDKATWAKVKQALQKTVTL